MLMMSNPQEAFIDTPGFKAITQSLLPLAFCLFLKNSELLPIAFPALGKAKHQSGRMKLRAASHQLTCAAVLRLPQMEPR